MTLSVLVLVNGDYEAVVTHEKVNEDGSVVESPAGIVAPYRHAYFMPFHGQSLKISERPFVKSEEKKNGE